MLGWSVVVDPRSPEEKDKSDDKLSYLLARWEASVNGLDFLDVLARKGKAKKLLSGGYPERYSAQAGDFLPLLFKPRSPGAMVPGGDVTLYRDRINGCLPEQITTIGAWDLS